MNKQQPSVSEILLEKNIKPSYQRMRVLEYILDHQTHPTVDEIYHELAVDIPTLSKATVYNSLSVLQESGLVRLINIENNEMRYDALIEDHGHFKCWNCGGITNFSIKMDALNTAELKGFRILDKNVYFKGICPECLEHQ